MLGYGLPALLSGLRGAMMCAAAASQCLATTETKEQRDMSLPLPPSHVGPKTLVQLPRRCPLLSRMMVVILSAFEAGLDALGRTNCELKRAGRV
jgi:hypothetical protein